MWPTPQDYNEAVQQPQLCFSDPDLMKSRVELNHLGLPRPMTGAFASVYRLSNIQGTSWAVRCFLEQRDDMKERYEAIMSSVNSSGCDLFAKFQYLERGVKIRSDWYPILKMEWIEGESLDKYLDRHVKTRTKVAALHKHFRELVASLKQAGIAHGDLQHGNILVTDSGLKLIDYDDMFVEQLKGKVSHELGHRNFQHPARSYNHFSEDLDNFAVWVIDLSLKALVVDSDLWRELKGGDDCLLFRHRDFKDPLDSMVLNHLCEHEEPDLQQSALLFREVLRLKPSVVPDYQSDLRFVSHLVNQQNLEVIADSESEIYGDPSSNEIQSSRASSFQNYDEWLSSVAQKNQTAKKAGKAVDRLNQSVAKSTKRMWRTMVSHVAPGAWTRGAVDEGNREFDEGNYSEAVRLYNDAVDVLKRNPSKQPELLCEVLVQLGYCHLEKDQLGTAAHYFREAQKLASPQGPLGEEHLQATLLLAATYFESEQLERAFGELSQATGNALILPDVVSRQRHGPFGRRLTLQKMMTELGHSYLAANNFNYAYAAYRAAMNACQWIKDVAQVQEANVTIARAAGGFCSAKVAEKEVEEALKIFCEMTKVETDSAILRDLIRCELKGALKADWKFAELMRALGHHLDTRGLTDQAREAYSASLAVLRVCTNTGKLALKMADCLLGLERSTEAVAVIRDCSDWDKGHSPELACQVAQMKDFGHALVVSAVVFDDDTQRHRYRCLDALVQNCPGPLEFERSLGCLEGSQIVDKLAFAELMMEFARDLHRLGRNKIAKVAYAAAFKSFKRSNASEAYGPSLMECLLAMGDPDVAANLLIEGGKMESMVRLMVNVMISQRNYDRTAICELMVKVAQVQMAKPPSSVTEEEIKQTISLLEWCAGDEYKEIVESTRLNAERWVENRELAFAHSLVEQGKFASALELFEKHEGPTGPNGILVQELWILRYISAAIIDRDRGYVNVTDGYAFGCALELLNNLRDRRALSPSFAVKVAELIRSAKSTGAEGYVEAVYSIFCECGRGFEHAVLSLRDCLSPTIRDTIEKRLNIKGNESFHVLISDGRFEFAIESPQDRGETVASNAGSDSWRLLNRTYFLIEREEFRQAISELERLLQTTEDKGLAFDASILSGYCYLLLLEELRAECAFKRALRSAILTQDQFRIDKASLCISSLYMSREKQRMLRQLIDPAITPRDLLKLATQQIGKQLRNVESLPDVLALSLLSRVDRGDRGAYASGRARRAVLALLRVKNKAHRLHIVSCLDAIGKHSCAAIVLKKHLDDFGFDPDVEQLLATLARRHIKSPELSRICTLYQTMDFHIHVERAQEEFVVNTTAKALCGQVPRRMLLDVRQDLLAMYGRNKLTGDFCSTLAATIVNSIAGDITGERRDRFLNDLLGISRVVEKVNGSAASIMRECLERLNPLPVDEKYRKAMEEELFLVADQT